MSCDIFTFSVMIKSFVWTSFFTAAMNWMLNWSFHYLKATEEGLQFGHVGLLGLRSSCKCNQQISSLNEAPSFNVLPTKAFDAPQKCPMFFAILLSRTLVIPLHEIQQSLHSKSVFFFFRNISNGR